MAGMDKYILMEELKDNGWMEEEDEQGWFLVPPQSLWDNRPKKLHLYDAQTLQEILGKVELDLN